MMTRRRALFLISAGSAGASLPGRATSTGRLTDMGIVMYGCRLKRAQLKKQTGVDIYEPMALLRHVRGLGAGGMQVALKTLDTQAAGVLRNEAEAGGMYIEAIIQPPKQDGEIDRFTAEMKTAVAVGARAARTVIIPGRRYEYFKSLESFRRHEAAGRASLERAAPIAEKLRLPLAVENHKDQRIDERVALLTHIDSEFVGCCVDTGNSFALLEDPIEAVKAFAPYAMAVHLKDQAVQLHPDGFLLDDAALGQGFLDLKRMVNLLRAAKPNLRFSLELITRDPLKVPCLSAGYWPTFPDLPATDLARTLRSVRRGAAESLQDVTSRPPDEQVALEQDNLTDSIHYARTHLGL